ncbi:MAG: ATP-dependent DNA ligase [Methanobacterium sp.]|uniref:ATP-dependent DNA ligase n=1 Tax=Methanobacterium sp. TaxID=2164 RepID=UPI003D660E8C|nr:ATP-dependent DNA ligase [Methanobacterium sp.]
MKYKELVDVYEALTSTTKRLEKTAILAEFLKNIPAELLPTVTLLSLGKVFPVWSEEEIGIGLKLIMKAISLVVGVSPETVEDSVRDKGDIGLAAEYLFGNKFQTTLFTRPLDLIKVYNNMVKLASVSGKNAVTKKMRILTELLSSASPQEAKYISRTVVEELRVGIGEGTIKDALSKAFNIEKEVVERALMLTNDPGLVAEVAKESGEEGLKKLTLNPGKPVKPMLAQLSKNIKESVLEMGWALCEIKYDGFRVQIHRIGDEIKVFTRRLDNIKDAVPEIVEYVDKHLPHEDFIVEGEIIATKEGKPISFQYILQRVRRKYEIERLRLEVPLTLYLFDVLYYKKSLIDAPFEERRQVLESISKREKGKFGLSTQVKVTPENIEYAEDLFKLSIEKGHEGIMIKDPYAPYMPGIRGKKMLKFKAEPETLDLAVTGGTYGKGRRANLIGSFLVAVQDEDGNLNTIAHTATGLDDDTLLELSNKVEALITEKRGRKVKSEAEIILEVAFSEIVKSPEYESGYSLRFPVVKRIREDLSVDDIDTVERVESIFKMRN